MDLKNQKRLASHLLKVGVNRVWFDPSRLSEVNEAITKADIKSLIKDKAIQKKPAVGISRFRARKSHMQKKKGRSKGPGSRKGRYTTRNPRKKLWVLRIRVQRRLLSSLKANKRISLPTYRILYNKTKSGLFRSKRHLQLYLEENKLVNKK